MKIKELLPVHDKKPMKLSETYLYMNEFGRWGNRTNNMQVIKCFFMKYQMSSDTEHKNMLGFTYNLLYQCLLGCFLVTLLYRHPVVLYCFVTTSTDLFL